MKKRTKVSGLILVGLALGLAGGLGTPTTGSAQLHSHQHRHWGPIHFCWGDCRDNHCCWHGSEEA